MRKKIVLALLLLPFSLLSYSQLKQLSPTLVLKHGFSAAKEAEYNKNQAKAIQLHESVENGEDYESLTDKEKELLDDWYSFEGSYWGISGDNCFAYYGDMPIAVTASSYLSAQGKFTYLPRNAHDLRFDRVWSEGVNGYGIGEFIEFTFDQFWPTITKIFVVNGHVKSESAWRNNSRVKKLKVYVNNKPYVILHLNDSRSTQGFYVDAIRRSENQKKTNVNESLVLRFEILEVYKGSKYDDVVISEIYFDGMESGCFFK